MQLRVVVSFSSQDWNECMILGYLPVLVSFLMLHTFVMQLADSRACSQIVKNIYSHQSSLLAEKNS